MRIAFIGLGTMGIPIVNRLCRSGDIIKAWDCKNIDEKKLDPDIALCKNIQEIFPADILVTMTSDDHATREVAKNSGLLNSIHTWINLSTVSISLTKSMLEQCKGNYHYHAIPVMGRHDIAKEGKLDVYYSGPSKLLDNISPLLKRFSKKIWYFGESPTSALTVKLAANFLLNTTISSLGQAFSLVEKDGVSSDKFNTLIQDSMFNCPVYKLYGDMISSRIFSPPGFPAKLGIKDLDLMLNASKELKAPLPFAALIREQFVEALAHECDDLDEAVIAMNSFRQANISS